MAQRSIRVGEILNVRFFDKMAGDEGTGEADVSRLRPHHRPGGSRLDRLAAQSLKIVWTVCENKRSISSGGTVGNMCRQIGHCGCWPCAPRGAAMRGSPAVQTAKAVNDRFPAQSNQTPGLEGTLEISGFQRQVTYAGLGISLF